MEEISPVNSVNADIDQSASNAEQDVIYVDVERTMAYIAGKMTFEEYTDILEQGIKEEPLDEDEYVEQDKLEATSSVPTHKRRYKKLPKHLEGLMGEANTKFALNELDEAERMCLEVIREAPNFPQPFQTLAMIYEEKQDMEKSMEFMLIAAHLSKTDVDEWKRVGDLYLENGNTKKAVFCYEKAARVKPSNTGLWHDVCRLHKQLGDERACQEAYQSMLVHMPDEELGGYMPIVRQVVKNWHNMEEKDKALTVIAKAFECHPSLIEAEDINVLLELYLGKGIYDLPLRELVRHCSIRLHYRNQPVYDAQSANLQPLPSEKPFRCETSPDMPIDLRSKLIICLVHHQFFECIPEVAGPMSSENPELVGDLFLDIVDAYMSEGHYSAARPILAILVDTAAYNMAAVWLRYAECLNALHESKQAADAFRRVIDMAPHHYQARLSLSALYQQLGNSEAALKSLELPSLKDASITEENYEHGIRLLMARCSLLHSQRRLREFADCAKMILFSFCRDIIDDERYRMSIIDYKGLRNRIQALRYTAGHEFYEQLRVAGSRIGRSAMTNDDLWTLYIRLCAALIEMKSFEEFENVSVLALICPQFTSNTEWSAEADFICLSACIMNRNANFAYSFVRDVCIKNMESPRAWNMFGQIATLSQNLRHNRFCIRLAMKYPDNLALGILNGNNALIAGSYKHALGEYMAALRHNPNDPLVNLLIGLCFIHMASQKFIHQQHSLLIQATAFLNQYLELRGECQESCYNIGRAYHQLGLLHLAANWYRKGLDCLPAVRDGDQFDMRCELAFNLCQIYKNSKSYHLMHYITQKYLVV